MKTQTSRYHQQNHGNGFVVCHLSCTSCPRIPSCKKIHRNKIISRFCKSPVFFLPFHLNSSLDRCCTQPRMFQTEKLLKTNLAEAKTSLRPMARTFFPNEHRPESTVGHKVPTQILAGLSLLGTVVQRSGPLLPSEGWPVELRSVSLPTGDLIMGTIKIVNPVWRLGLPYRHHSKSAQGVLWKL